MDLDWSDGNWILFFQFIWIKNKNEWKDIQEKKNPLIIGNPLIIVWKKEPINYSLKYLNEFKDNSTYELNDEEPINSFRIES